MLLEINDHSEDPIYKQLCDQIIIGIASGQLAAGESLPSVRQLADELGVNMMTISKAYNQLKDQGYLLTDRRKGTTVVQPHSYQSSEEKSYRQQLTRLLAEAVLHQKNEQDILQDVTEVLARFKSFS